MKYFFVTEFSYGSSIDVDYTVKSMLSGCIIARYLACPHSAQNHDAYNLSHGEKMTRFYNHQKFMPADHPFLSLIRERHSLNFPSIYLDR